MLQLNFLVGAYSASYLFSALVPVASKVCYVQFEKAEDVGVAMHLTNTVFIDRALIVMPVPDGK